MEPFATIVADPPWPYESAGPRSSLAHRPNRDRTALAKIGASSVKRYGSMTIDQLSALRIPVATNAHLYLWTTNAFMVEAHVVARAWGFVPKTIITWVKLQAGSLTEPSMKTGHYFRGATEHCVFAVRGSLRLATTRAIPTVFFSPRLPHSVKPDSFYGIVEECSPEPRLDLFARTLRIGWRSWGNEVTSSVEVAETDE